MSPKGKNKRMGARKYQTRKNIGIKGDSRYVGRELGAGERDMMLGRISGRDTARDHGKNG